MRRLSTAPAHTDKLACAPGQGDEGQATMVKCSVLGAACLPFALAVSVTL